MKSLFSQSALAVTLMFVFTSVCTGQVLTISPDPSSGAECPLGQVTHFVTTVPGTGGLPNCTYTWTVTNGFFVVGGTTSTTTTGTSVFVRWNDAPGTGTLQVTAGACSGGGDGLTKTSIYTKMSLNGQQWPSPSSCLTAIDVPLCSPPAINLCADHMYVQGTGGVAQPPLKEVDRYDWTIPAGWIGNTTNGPAVVSTVLNTIQITPMATTTGNATIIVQGSVAPTCGSDPAKSATKTYMLTRTPAVAISPPSGFTQATCGLTQPLTFSLTNTPSCASSFSWTLPSGWTGSSSTNSITVTPNGLNGGTLSVNITLSSGGVVQRSLNIPFSNQVPNISGSINNLNFEWCNYETFTFTANPPTGFPSNFGWDWYAGGGIQINGGSYTPDAPLHTSSNAVTIDITGSVYGTQTIGVRMSNGGCTASDWFEITKKVGPYDNSEFFIIEPSEYCPNSVADFRPNYIDFDITGWQWAAPFGWGNSGNGTAYFHVSLPWDLSGGGYITLQVQNRCGWTNTPAVVYVYDNCPWGYVYMSSPNPASSTLVLTNFKTKNDVTAVLLDKTSQQVKAGKIKDGRIELDISDVPDGNYFLQVKFSDRTEKQQIQIKH